MIINVGSKNEVKVRAVKETLQNYPELKEAGVVSLEVPSGVSKQPKSMEETIQGAMNRAGSAFKNCSYSFGIESGLMKVPNTKSGYMDFCACAILDGTNYHIGFSSAFEFPISVTNLIFKEGIDANDAFYRAGLTNNPKLGSSEGAIGLLTKGRVSRCDYTKQAVINALIHLEN